MSQGPTPPSHCTANPHPSILTWATLLEDMPADMVVKPTTSMKAIDTWKITPAVVRGHA